MKIDYIKDVEAQNAVLVMKRFQFVYYLWLAVVLIAGIALVCNSIAGHPIVTAIVVLIVVLLLVLSIRRYPQMIREWMVNDYENHPDPCRYYNLKVWEYQGAKNSQAKSYRIRGELAEAALDMGDIPLASEILSEMNASYADPEVTAKVSLQKMRFYNATNNRKKVRQEDDALKAALANVKEPAKAQIEAESRIQMDIANANYTAMIADADKLVAAKNTVRNQAKAADYKAQALTALDRPEEAAEQRAEAEKLGGRMFAGKNSVKAE